MSSQNFCPRCNDMNVVTSRDVGCFFVVLVFVSLGLGLLMFPFLPVTATCNTCGAKWKV